MSTNTNRTLRAKLLRIVGAVFFLVGVMTLTGVAWVNAETERERLADIETQVRSSIAGRARATADNQALALRGLVADNVYTDIQKLVQRTVSTDPEIVYGVFVSAEGAPWAYASPTTRNLDPQNTRAILERWRELSLPAGSWTSRVAGQRQVTQFGQELVEVSSPVIDGEEVLGTIRYGFSTGALRLALVRARTESQRALWRAFLWIAVAVSLSTLAGSVLVSRAASRIVHPLQRLTAAACRIAEGEQGVRVQVETCDELQVLGDAFNHMQAANEVAMRKLGEAMQAALEASRLKSEFVANMSHEIRTPMNGIMGITRLILKLPLDAKLRRYAETIDASASTLMTIINDVLDFSKMEAGKYTLQSVPFDATGVLQEVAELESGRAHGKGLELVYRSDPAIGMVVGDPDRYRQILNNLVSNAIKFTDEGEVFINLTVDSRDEKEVILRTIVQDAGVGIGKADQAKLFEAFSQVDGSMVRRHGGTGLGLVISKRLVEMMGGEIGFQSECGVGSTFWFTIRVALSDVAASAPRCAFPEGSRALVVEASRRWCRIIEEHMMGWGLRCDVHHDGLPALEHLRRGGDERPYDVIVVGARLRDVAIEAFVKSLRQVPGAQRVPLIVLTQLGETATLTEVESEVTAQITKPLRPSELYNCILELFAGGPSHISVPRVRTPPRVGFRPRVLIVDDNHINRFVAIEQLEYAGYAADVATNGKEAVTMVQNNHYAVVLMDCQMPVMDGYTATREIRAWEGDRRHTPIIALTAHAMVGERDKVISAGMDDYLTKPLKPQALERALKRYVANGVVAGELTAGADDTTLSADVDPTVTDGAGASELTPGSDDAASPIDLDPTMTRTRRLSNLFVAGVPEMLSDLEAAIDGRDASLIRQKAHKLKGSCLVVGAEAMAKLAETLQLEADRGELDASSSRARELRAHFERVAVLLRAEVAEGNTRGGPERTVPISVAPPAGGP